MAFPVKDRAYYICSERNRKGAKVAPCPLVKKEPLEEFVLEQLREELFIPERIKPLLEELSASVKSQTEERHREIDKMEVSLTKVETELSNLYKAVAEGIPAAHLAQPIEQRLGRKSELEARLAKLKGAVREAKPVTITEELVKQVQEWAWQHLKEGDPSRRKAYIQECVQKIEVNGNQVHITYAFKPLTPSKHDVGFCWLPGLDSNQQPSG